MEFLELAKKRYSERFFDSRPVEQDKLDKINVPLMILVCYDSRLVWRNPDDRYYRDYNSGEQDASITATTMMYEAEELGGSLNMDKRI